MKLQDNFGVTADAVRAFVPSASSPTVSPVPASIPNVGLWGDDGLLARFTRAANGISDIVKRVNEILDRKYITLSGQLEITGSKRGERYAELHAAQPYHHSLYLIIRGDQGRQGDDELNVDLIGKLDGVYDVTFWVDEDYDNVTTPSRIIAPELSLPQDESAVPAGEASNV